MGKRLQYLLWTALLVMLVLPAATTQAQCVPQQSWAVYYVRVGETLTGLAARFSTTVNTLINANCLTATVLFVGQALRVPPGRIVNADMYVNATYQAFDGGFMVWSADSSAISVYTYGDSRLRSFNARTYSRWSPPAATIVPPPGRLLPGSGFGRVWNGQPAISASLGWALTPEQGYTMLVRYNANARVEFFSIPDGRVLTRITNTNIWLLGGIQSPPPAPAPVPTSTPIGVPITRLINATYQPFEGGFMVWRSDNSVIWAYVYNTSDMSLFAPSTYGNWGIDTFSVAPFGRVRPDQGFGRVWSNVPLLRSQLGWALTGEQGFQSLVNFDASFVTQSFTLPDGRLVSRVTERVWSLSGT
jgi:LysM repeat protein